MRKIETMIICCSHFQQESQFGRIIHGLNFRLVSLHHFFASDFQARGESSILYAEVFGHQMEVLNFLGPRNCFSIGCSQALMHYLPEKRVIDCFLYCLYGTATACQELLSGFIKITRLRRVLLEADETCQELAIVTDDHRVGQAGQSCLNLILDEDWRDVLPSCGDDEFLYATSDEKSPIFDPTKVTRMEKTLRVDSFSRFFGVLEVTHADISAPHTDLTLLFTFCTINLHFCTWSSSSYFQVILLALEGQNTGLSVAFRSRAFSHTVSIPEKDIERKEGFADSGVQWGRTKDEKRALVESQGFLHPVEDQIFGQFELKACRLFSLFLQSALFANALRPSYCIDTYLPIFAEILLPPFVTSIIFSYIFSQIRGTEKKASGLTSCRVWINVPVRAVGSAKNTWEPIRRAMQISMNCPAECESGRQLTIRLKVLFLTRQKVDLQQKMKLSWEIMTPFGMPVVPLVQINVEQLPGWMRFIRSESSGACFSPFPSSMKSLQDTTLPP